MINREYIKTQIDELPEEVVLYIDNYIKSRRLNKHKVKGNLRDHEKFIKSMKELSGSIEDTHLPNGKPKRKMTQSEYLRFLNETYGSINDPTFVEPPEVEYESQREEIQ